MHDFDIAVIGGGPAGAAAAITAAAAGLSVVIIEREAFPRSAPGESVHPGIQPLLKQLGVEDAVLKADFLRYPGHVVRSKGVETYTAFGADDSGEWLGFQLWRPQFDSILLERASSLGVKVLQPCRALSPIIEAGALSGVVTSEGTLRAGFVIDATGRWRILSRWLNLDWQKHGAARRAWYGYARGHCPSRETIPLLSISPTGWYWIARVRPDVYAWTLMTPEGERPHAHWLPSEISDLTPITPPTGADVAWGISSAPAGNSYFLVGDAAFSLDPAAGHGILKALMSGIYAGQLVCHVHESTLLPEDAASIYSRWMFDWFRNDASKLDGLYSAHFVN